uniref:ShKT domain-containing protein n=3 Tax=Wuchereria bancrofti TaxID=6293 RepID=A0AAF5Q054_WUCBA
MAQQHKRQQQQKQLIITFCILLISLNQITITIADNNISYNDNDIVYDDNSSYNNNNDNNDNNTININYVANERYSVLRLRTTDLNQFLSVKKLIDSSIDLKVNFWKIARNINDVTDVMVPASTMKKVLHLLNDGNVNVTVTIPDVERLIIKREKKNGTFEQQQRYRDDSGSISGRSIIEFNKYDFYSYGSYNEMMKWLRSLARKYPEFVRNISIGKSHEKRSIDGLEIGGNNQSKRVFWIDGGIHAREWAAPHTALYFIHQLTSKYGYDKQITKYVDELTWVIIPCLNPDGYEFTRSSTNPNVRLWRKNRSPFVCEKDQWGRNRCCRGVDLNRNFDFHFKESGSSDDPCAEIYQGKAPFSEPETRAVRDAIMSNRYRGRIDAFITLHTYSQLWIHPYGHRKDTYPGDIQDLYKVGKNATDALSKLYGTKYIVGSGADTLYPASGGSEDWAKQTAGIKYVYLLELRPDEKNWDGFILDERQLIPTATETWAGIRVVADAVIERANRKITRINDTIKQEYRFGNGSAGSCYDLRHACKRWVQEKESICKTVPIFMREQCAYSCGHC